MHCNNLRLVLGLGLVRVSSRVMVRIRVKVRVSVMARVSIRTSCISLLPASNLHSSPKSKSDYCLLWCNSARFWQFTTYKKYCLGSRDNATCFAKIHNILLYSLL